MFAPVEELKSMYRRAASLTGNSKAEDNEKGAVSYCQQHTRRRAFGKVEASLFNN